MSVTSTHAHVLIEQAAEESRREEHLHDRPSASERPTVSELLQHVVPDAFFVPLAGPPVLLLLGPWLLLVLLIRPRGILGNREYGVSAEMRQQLLRGSQHIYKH